MQRKPSLPISHPDNRTPLIAALRRRLSSLSLQPLTSPANEWALRHTKSVSSAIGSGESLRRWWDWGWSWILSRKPVFSQDLELNEHSRGSWRHVFYKFTSEIRRLIRPIMPYSPRPVGTIPSRTATTSSSLGPSRSPNGCADSFRNMARAISSDSQIGEHVQGKV